MKLRSGKVTSGIPTKLQYYNATRQCEINEFIDNEFTPIMQNMMEDVNSVPKGKNQCMHRICGVTYLFSYLNSVAEDIIMSPRLKKFRSIALNQCDQFKKEGEMQVHRRIEEGIKMLPDTQESNPKKRHTPDSVRAYYMTYLNAMLDETTYFKSTYGGRN